MKCTLYNQLFRMNGSYMETRNILTRISCILKIKIHSYIMH